MSAVLSPTMVAAYDSAAEVDLIVQATYVNGLDRVTGVLRSPSEAERLTCATNAPAVGTAEDGRWICTFEVQQGAETGRWSLDSLKVTSGSVERVVDAAEMSSLEFPSEVQVRGAPPEPASLLVTPEQVEFADPYVSIPVTAVVIDQYGDTVTDPSLAWASADESVARVTGDGVISASGVGTTDISVTAGTLTAQIAVTVPSLVQRLTIEPGQLELKIGDTDTLAATVFNQFGTAVPGARVSWSSGNSAAASVDSTGVVTGNGRGVAWILGVSETARDSIRVRVTSFAADLAVGVQISPDTLVLGDTLWTTFSVRNQGPDEMPRYLFRGHPEWSRPVGSVGPDCVWFAPSGGATAGTLSCDRTDPLAPFETWTRTIGWVLSGQAGSGRIRVSAGVESFGMESRDTFDPVSTNDTVTVERDTRWPATDVSVSVSHRPDTAKVGEPLTFEVTVANAGPDGIDGYEVVSSYTGSREGTGILPEGCTGTPSSARCPVGALGPGADTTLTIQVTPTRDGPASLYASLIYGGGLLGYSDADTENNSAGHDVMVAPPEADIAVSIQAEPAATEVGDPFDLVLSLQNLGPDSVAGYRVSWTAFQVMPPALEVVAPLPTNCYHTVDLDAVRGSCALDGLAPGDVRVRRITLRSLVTDTITGDVFASYSSPITRSDPADENDRAEVVIPVSPPSDSADLSLTMSVEPDPVTVGNEVFHYVLVTNDGPDPADEVALEVTVVGDVTLSAPAQEGCVDQTEAGSHTWICSMGTLAPNTTTSLSLGVTTNAVETLTSSAAITSFTGVGDPDDADRSVTATTTVQSGADPWDLALVSYELSPNPVTRTAELTHTVILENQGTATITEAVANIRTYGTLLPGAGGTCTPVVVSGGRGYNCFVQDLEPGRQDTVVVSLFPQTAGELLDSEVRLDIVSGGTETDLADNDGGTTAQVVGFVPPVSATINSPVDGATFSSTDAISFDGRVVDSQGVDVTGFVDLEWSSSLDGSFASAAFFSSDALSPGAHTITFTALDGATPLDSDAIALTVEGEVDLRLSIGAYGSGASLATSYELGDTVPMFASMNNIDGPDTARDAVLVVTVTGDVVSNATVPLFCAEETLTSPARLRWTCDMPPLGPFTGSEILGLAFIPQSVGPISVIGELTSAGLTDVDPSNNLDSESTTITDGSSIGQADLILELADSTTRPDLGGPYTTGDMVPLLLTVANAGPNVVDDAVATVTVTGAATPDPNPPSYCSITTLSASAFAWTCALPTVDPVLFPLEVRLPFTVDAAGTITVSGTVTSARADPNAANNSETESATVNDP